MKLTWFGGSTFRIHIGGRIIVTDAAAAAAAVEVSELRSGADLEIAWGGTGGLPAVDLADWRPPRSASLLAEDGDGGGVLVARTAGQGLLLHAAGDSALLLVDREVGAAGRWSGDAVLVLHGAAVRAPASAIALLERLAPKLLLLAAGEAEVTALFPALRPRLGHTALVALEPGMALEA